MVRQLMVVDCIFVASARELFAKIRVSFEKHALEKSLRNGQSQSVVVPELISNFSFQTVFSIGHIASHLLDECISQKSV